MASGLTSASTDAQVQACYENNASYIELGLPLSVQAAKDFTTACRFILFRQANSMAKGSNSLAYDRTMIERQLQAAEKYVLTFSSLAADIPGPKVTRGDFRNMRT